MKNVADKAEGNLIVILDNVEDPKNFGCFVRSSVFLGADAVFVNQMKLPQINSALCKASSGATESVNLFSLKSLGPFLSSAIKQEWVVATAVLEKEEDIQMMQEKDDNEKKDDPSLISNDAQLIQSKKIALSELTISKNNNVIIIFGYEPNEISQNLCHFNLFIPPRHNKEHVTIPSINLLNSLNSEVSLGVIIYCIKSKMKK
jgi:tRNA G18 (ribose-2'-O)-methylase SpoU